MPGRLVLYIGEKNVSSWSMRAHVALSEKGLTFEERTVEIMHDPSRAKRREIGPTGRVPVLHHCVEGEDPLVIPDTLAILEYLEETFPPPKYPALWPAEPRARARARWLSAAMHSGYAKLRESMSFNLCFLETRPPASREALTEASEILSLWETALRGKAAAGPFLLGDFGGVDAMFAPVVVRLTSFAVPTSSTSLAAAYMKAVLARPSVEAWLQAARRLPPVASE